VKVAILVEGKNEREFLENLINHLGFDSKKAVFYHFSGKSNFFDLSYKIYNELIPQIASDQIDKVLFVVDADDTNSDRIHGGFSNTQIALDQIINQLGIKNISRTYIMCDPATKTGYLESFILSTIPADQKSCIDAFLECSQFESKHLHKVILNKIYYLAYPKYPFDFLHPNFDSLKAVLTDLLIN